MFVIASAIINHTEDLTTRIARRKKEPIVGRYLVDSMDSNSETVALGRSRLTKAYVEFVKGANYNGRSGENIFLTKDYITLVEYIRDRSDQNRTLVEEALGEFGIAKKLQGYQISEEDDDPLKAIVIRASHGRNQRDRRVPHYGNVFSILAEIADALEQKTKQAFVDEVARQTALTRFEAGLFLKPTPTTGASRLVSQNRRAIVPARQHTGTFGSGVAHNQQPFVVKGDKTTIINVQPGAHYHGVDSDTSERMDRMNQQAGRFGTEMGQIRAEQRRQSEVQTQQGEVQVQQGQNQDRLEHIIRTEVKPTKPADWHHPDGRNLENEHGAFMSPSKADSPPQTEKKPAAKGLRPPEICGKTSGPPPQAPLQSPSPLAPGKMSGDSPPSLDQGLSVVPGLLMNKFNEINAHSRFLTEAHQKNWETTTGMIQDEGYQFPTAGIVREKGGAIEPLLKLLEDPRSQPRMVVFGSGESECCFCIQENRTNGNDPDEFFEEECALETTGKALYPKVYLFEVAMADETGFELRLFCKDINLSAQGFAEALAFVGKLTLQDVVKITMSPSQIEDHEPLPVDLLSFEDFVSAVCGKDIQLVFIRYSFSRNQLDKLFASSCQSPLYFKKCQWEDNGASLAFSPSENKKTKGHIKLTFDTSCPPLQCALLAMQDTFEHGRVNRATMLCLGLKIWLCREPIVMSCF